MVSVNLTFSSFGEMTLESETGFRIYLCVSFIALARLSNLSVLAVFAFGTSISSGFTSKNEIKAQV